MIYRPKSNTLSDVCDIQSGYTARSALISDDIKGRPALQLGDLRGHAEFPLSKASRFKLEGKLKRYMVAPKDILLRSRGEKLTAVMAVGREGDEAVALLPLMILRAHSGVVLPEFLVWHINQPATQRYLCKSAYGTALRMIKRAAIENMPISIPDLATQKMVVEASRLSAREAALLRELARKKEEFMSFALLRQVRTAQLQGNEAGHPLARQPSKHTDKL